jgi:hypothetical protein
MHPAPLDGNATAGDLADVFAFDSTIAEVTCSACSQTQAVALLHAYVRAAGIVLRCPSCNAVQLRFMRSGDRAWLDMHGIALLEIRLSPDR